jgi:hypothetical protein
MQCYGAGFNWASGPTKAKMFYEKGINGRFLKEIDDFSAGLEASLDLVSPLLKPKNNNF